MQAQGGGVEESSPWSVIEVPTKRDGNSYLDNLKKKLTPAALRVRKTCFEKALRWINGAPSNGYVVNIPIKTTFLPNPPIRDIRVDGEIFSGAAFKDMEGE